MVKRPKVNSVVMIIGNTNTFALDIGADYPENQIRKIDVVINNRWVCVDDHSACVPQFITSLELDIKRIRRSDFSKYNQYFTSLSVHEIHECILKTRTEGAEEFDIEDDRIYPLHTFMDWGPTTDNLTCFLIPKDKEIYLTHQFWREEHCIKSEIGVIHATKVGLEEVLGVLEKAVVVLKK